MNKRNVPHWIAVVFAIGGFVLLVFSLPGCAVTHTGGYWCSPPLNCIEGHAKIEPPPVARNLYDIMYKETGQDRGGKGFIRYDIINTPQCQLNRKLQIDVPGHGRQTLSCDIGNIFANYYIPIKRPTRIVFKLLGPRDELIEEKAVTVTPDAKMIGDYGGIEYGWRIIAKLTTRGNLQLWVSDSHWIDPRSLLLFPWLAPDYFAGAFFCLKLRFVIY